MAALLLKPDLKNDLISRDHVHCDGAGLPGFNIENAQVLSKLASSCSLKAIVSVACGELTRSSQAGKMKVARSEKLPAVKNDMPKSVVGALQLLDRPFSSASFCSVALPARANHTTQRSVKIVFTAVRHSDKSVLQLHKPAYAGFETRLKESDRLEFKNF